MAREMAVVLAAMRPEGRSSLPQPTKWAWWLIGIVGGIGLVGIFSSLMLSFDWRGGLLAGVWGALAVGGGYAAWRFLTGTHRYKEEVVLKAREEVLRLEGRYKALIQYASDVFLILSKGGRVEYVSPSSQRVLGYAPGQMEGTFLREYVHPEDRALVETALLRQSSAFFTVRLQHREGNWRYYEAVGQPLFSDAMIGGYLLTLRDVTDRQREEAQRREKEATALRLAIERERAEYEKNLIEQSKRQLEEAYRIIEQKNRDIQESLQYAARIQQGMVASVAQMREHLSESFVFWRPRDVVSGDFYWFQVREEKVYIAAADCTGHGVPGALMTMISSAMLTQALLVEGHTQPDAILAATHRLIRRALRQDVPGATSQDGMDIALMVYDKGTQQLWYAGANRPLWLAYPGEAEIVEVEADRRGIGGASAPAELFFTLHVLDLPPGTWVYAASDGYADQFGGPHGKKYMAKRFKRFLRQIASLSAEAQAEALVVELDGWKGEYPQVDDILVLGFRL